MQFADNSGISVKYILISLLIKQYASIDRSYLAYKYTTLVTRQRDVVVVRTALTAAMVVPSTMFKVYDPPNSETLVSKLFPNFAVNTIWEAVHVQFPIRKLVFTIIPIAREGSIVTVCIIRRVRLEAALSRMITLWHQSTARAIRKQSDPMHSNRSRGTLMSYGEHSAQRCFKSNAPIVCLAHRL